MRSLLHRALLLAVVMLTIPAGIGLSVTRCAHSGKVAIDIMASGDDCGMGADSGCMEHILLKVSDFSLHWALPGLPAVFVPIRILQMPQPQVPSLPSLRVSISHGLAPPDTDLTLPLRN